MATDEYHLSKKVAKSFNDTIGELTGELKKEGFGIITTIDLRELFRKKIRKEFTNYVILSACNPNYAYEILQMEDHAGIFLPCNVTVREHENGETEVSVANPEYLVRGSGNLNLLTFATEIKEILETVLEKL